MAPIVAPGDVSSIIAARLLRENAEARGTVEAVAASGEVYNDSKQAFINRDDGS